MNIKVITSTKARAFIIMPKLLLLIGLFICGLLYVLLIPPFQVSDEMAHFSRAFGISEGFLLCQKRDQSTGSDIPKQVVKEIHSLDWLLSMNSHRILHFKDISNLYSQSKHLNNKIMSDTEFSNYNNTAMYSPIPYLPQAVVIHISVICHLKIMTAFYLARFANMSVSLFLLICSFNILFKMNNTLFLLFASCVSTPIFLFQMGSCSIDSFINSVSFLCIVLLLRLLSTWDKKKYIYYLILTVLIAFSKSIYFFIPLCIIPLLFLQKHTLSFKIKSSLPVFLCALIPLIIWSSLSFQIYNPLQDDGPYPSEKIMLFLQTPFAIIKMFMNTWIQMFWQYCKTYVSGIGWDGKPLNGSAEYFFIICMSALVSSKNENLVSDFHLRKRLLLFFAFIAGICIVTFSIYLTWESRSSTIQEGINGRYFVPIFPLFFLSISNLIIIEEKLYNIWFKTCLAVVIAYQIYSIVTIVGNYYG